ncbi:efflux RND transporter permease subunit [Pseudohalioglobus lutimaris]|uniref:AcrB/AcrD/AcrF family protein n=1 Tax=Pseudohalioglobus lutimaris TaxID=1737061 RepID=A0A2N5X873_9GAMM|nr:efflux RND transporter permease subunit [Pseudohalioglobus lutimaris]PLW70681.1 AcrB/AcrD/AcrF family protein [Pseudohalioglobus lutimaris]
MTRLSINNPAAIAVIVVLIIIFGLIAVRGLPIQLLPDVDRPAISIETDWRAAAPEEVEESIVQPQEQVLRNIEGLENMVSEIRRGSGRIRLDFRVGWDMQRALIDVITQLNQAADLPADAGEPQIRSGGSSGRGQAASLLIYTLPGNENRDVATYQELIDREVEPRLAQVPGVARVGLASEREPEIHVTLDTQRLAARNIQIPEVADTLRRAVDVSGGFADVGRRRYTVRYLGQRSIEELGDLVVAWQNGEPVRLTDVATVERGLRKRVNLSFRNGFPAYYISMIPSYDANTVELLDALNSTIKEINEEVLEAEGLTIELSFDASLHIRRAIALVQQNLLLGLVLASLVLWYFLRNVRATLLIAATIPLSLLVAFVVLKLTGKTLNVISLAGLAFAVGLVMDAAIIVQENIVRLRASGMAAYDATIQGCREVSGALFSSTLTSVAIFLPILFMVGVEGQLFKDLAITLTTAVSFSLITAMTILPAAGLKLSTAEPRPDRLAQRWRQLADLVIRITDNPAARSAWIVAILGGSLLLSWIFLPKIDFLPKARIDSVQTYFAAPPGVNLDTLEQELISDIIARLKPYYDGEKEPHIRGYNLASWGATDTMNFIYPEKSEDIPALIELLRNELYTGLTDTVAYVSHSSMLNLNNDGPDAINIDLQGSDLEQLKTVAAATMELTQALWEDGVVFSAPDLSAGEAELRVYPREQRLSLAGLDRRAVGDVVRTYTDGLWAGEYFDGNNRYDLILRGETWNSPEQLAAMPLATPLAGIQTIGELAEIRRGVGPAELQRVDGQRTVTIFLIPPDNVTMEEALQRLRDEVEPKVKPLLPQGARLGYRGSADRLSEALRTVGVNFLLAILILYLIMAALFKSGRDAILVLLVMPMAIAGGLAALKLLNLVTYQSLDLLTMIGFIILLGLVVNNAILLVDQTRSAQKSGMTDAEAVHQAVLFRARPIFMSTLTSIFGMLPLMLIPGVGSEIYRGLATVIVGGMVICAMFTLLLLPSLLRFGKVKPFKEQV